MKAISLSALCLCLLVGWASSDDFAWKMGKTYTYVVRGRMMTGMSELNTQYSGMEMDYKIMLTRTDQNTVVLKPFEFKIVEVHDVLHGGWRDSSIEGHTTPVELKPEFRTFLESPIVLTLNRGLIESIKVEKDLPVWAVNIKKAQVSHFVLDTTGVRVVLEGNLNRKIDHVNPNYPTLESGRFFETLETTVLGECKTYYTVSQNEAFVKPFPFHRDAMPDETSEESMENMHTVNKLERELSWHRTWHEFCNEGDQVFEIIKSVNFTTCTKKPVYAVLSPASRTNERAGDNTLGSFGLRAVVSRILACGKHRKEFTILKIRQEEKFNAGLHHTEKLIAGSIKNLTLIDCTDKKDVPRLRNPVVIPNLVYKFPRNKLHNMHDEMNREEGDVLPMPNLVDAPLNTMLISPVKIEEMKNRVELLLNEIVKDLMNKENTKDSIADKETLSKITIVAKIMRHCSYKDIEEIYRKIATKKTTVEDRFRHHILLNCISVGGTNPNIKFVLDLIRKREINGEHGAQILMTLPLYIRTPTKELLREYFNLIKMLPVEIGKRQLKTTALLSFSTLLHQACVNTNIKNTRYPVQVYGEFCDHKFVETEFLDFFMRELEKIVFKEDNDEITHWKIVHMTVLGNIGHPNVIPLVQRIMDNCINPFIKTKALFVLKRLIVSRSNQNLPEKVQVRGVDRMSVDCLTDEIIEKRVLPILVSVAFDKGEHPHVRMAAISMLMYTTNADLTIWQQLAYLTWFEVSEDVRMFIYTTFRNLAELEGAASPVHWPLIRKARFVLTLCKPVRTLNWMKSVNMFDTVHLESHMASFFHQFSTFGAKDSWIPDSIYYRNFHVLGDGALGHNPLEFSWLGHSTQKLLDYFFEKIWVPTTGERQGHEDLNKIRDLLGINPDNFKMTDKVMGSLHIKLHNEMERLFTVNKDVIDRLMTEWPSKLTNGLPIHWQKTLHLFEDVTEVPSLFGIPITYKYEIPMHMSVRGNVKLVRENNAMQLQADLHPIYAWKSHHKLMFKVPFLNKKFQSGVQNHMVTEFPFRCLIGRGEHGLWKLAITPTRLHDTTPTGELNLITFHQKPYTAIVKDEMWPLFRSEAAVMKPIHRALIDIDGPHNVDLTYGEKTLGWVLRYEADTDYKKEEETMSGWMRFLHLFKTPMGLWNLGHLGHPFVVRSMRKLSIDLSKTETKTLVFVFGGGKKLVEHQNENTQNEINAVVGMIGIKKPIKPVTEKRGIEHILVKGTPSTVQYLVHFRMNRDDLMVRKCIGEPCKEVANKMPTDVPWLVPIREFLVNSRCERTELNYCVELKNHYEWPEWANRRDLVVLRKVLLNTDLVVKVNGELNFGRTCDNMEHKIKIDTEMKRGTKMTEWAREKSLLAKKCMDDEKKGFTVSRVCLRLAREQAMALNEGKHMITWTDNLPVPFKGMCFMIQDILKNQLYTYMHHERFPVEGGAGEKRMVIDWHVNPDREFVHLDIIKPETRLTFRNIKTNKFWKVLLPLTPTQTIVEHIHKRVIRPIMHPICTLENNFISTFDNVTYKFGNDIATNCEHILMQDCTGKWPMSVLVRDIHTHTKMVTVLLDHGTKIEIMPATHGPMRWIKKEGENILVRVNGQDVTTFPKIIRSNEQRLDRNEYICKIERMVNGGIQIITPKIRVATDCNRVVVFGDNVLRKRTCGLCGDFNGEKTADLRSPKNCPLSSGSVLVASYAFPPIQGQGNECRVKPELKTLVEKEEEDCKKVRAHIPVPMHGMEVKTMEADEEWRPRMDEYEMNDNECWTKKKLVRHITGFGECHSEKSIRLCAPECMGKNIKRKLIWFDCADMTNMKHVSAWSQSIRKQLYMDVPTECVRNM